MSQVNYRELLWDFTLEGAERKRGVSLRVFASEGEIMTARRARPSIGEVFLPIESSSTGERTREQRGTQPDRFRLQDRGRALWNAIPFEAKQPLLDATPAEPCRLKISANAAAIDDLPWEWLNDGGEQPFALRPSVRLARSIPIPAPAPPRKVQLPLRVLLVLTNPKDERLLNPYMEINAVAPAFQWPAYVLHIQQEATREAFVRELEAWQPHIVHYIGHAGIDAGQGNLILHDQSGLTDWINAAQLATWLPLSTGLLCLSTCFTAPNYQILGLPRLATAGARFRLPTAIANRYPVREQSVRAFWEHFYRRLVEEDGNVNEAFTQAQLATSALDATDWGSFSLVIRDQTGRPLRLLADTELELSTPVLSEQDLAAAFASRWANDLTSKVLDVNVALPEEVRARLESEAAEAVAHAENLVRQDQS